MTTLLITGIGGDIAQGVATIVRERFPEWRLLGADIHERHGGCLFVDQVHLAPRVSDSGYDRWLQALIVREQVDICVPTSEAEIIHLARAARPTDSGTKFVMANTKAVEIGSDKLLTAEFLKSTGIAGPWTIPVEAFSEQTPLPCILKTRRGAGSKTVFLCKTATDVQFYRDHYPAAVLQELLLPDDQEVTCAVYRSQSGRTVVLQLLRTLVGGFTGWAQVIDEPEVTSQCIRVAEGLDLRGAINVQLRLTSAGPRIFEINPRFSSTVLIRDRMGFRDAVWSLQETLGSDVAFEHPQPGTIAVRVQGAAVCHRGRDTNGIQ